MSTLAFDPVVCLFALLSNVGVFPARDVVVWTPAEVGAWRARMRSSRLRFARAGRIIIDGGACAAVVMVFFVPITLITVAIATTRGLWLPHGNWGASGGVEPQGAVSLPGG
jgi:hypothetical protein